MESNEIEVKREEYKKYIEEHKENIIQAYKRFKSFIAKCDTCINLNNKELECLKNDIIHHDDSKFSESEFEAYRKHYFPCSFEKEGKTEKIEFEKAKIHHYQNNNHHPQHPSRKKGLNKVACIHNVLDWIAMSYKYNEKVWEYYESSEIKNILNPLEKEYIEQILNLIKVNEKEFYPVEKDER